MMDFGSLSVTDVSHMALAVGQLVACILLTLFLIRQWWHARRVRMQLDRLLTVARTLARLAPLDENLPSNVIRLQERRR